MELLHDLALRMVNVGYLWGGKNPNSGFDCSGLVNCLLHAFGLDIPGSNAQMLHDHFSLPANHCSQDPQLGALAFYGSSKKDIHHVAMCLSKIRMIEAGGGGPKITTLELAKSANAYVKITPLYVGPNLQGVYLPDYEELVFP